MDISVRSEGTWTAEDRSWLASRDGTDTSRSITLDTSAFTEGTHYPDGFLPSGTLVTQLESGLYGPYAGNAQEAQTVTITGTPTGGTWTLTFAGQTTAGIAYNATATAVRSALEALSNVNTGDVTVTGGPGPDTPYVVTWTGQYAGEDVPQMTASGASLTGGSTPAVGVATTTAGGGVSGGLVNAGFTFSRVTMRAGGPDVGAALHHRGVIKVSRLPAASGLDAAARVELASRFRFE